MAVALNFGTYCQRGNSLSSAEQTSGHGAVGSAPGWGSGGREFKSHCPDHMDQTNLPVDTAFPYRLFRFVHRRALDAVSSSYLAIISKDSRPVGLILMIDIPERWYHARGTATLLWQIFVREFAHSVSPSTLNRFEQALKELNLTIVTAQEKIKQPISVAAVILEGNQMHFSTIGTSRVLLVNGESLNDVTAGAHKTGQQFAAVTSGEIDGSDTVCVANQNLYEFLAAEPNELWNQSTVEQLAQEIQTRAQNSHSSLSLVLLRYASDNPGQSTLYWEESEKRYPIRWPKFSFPTWPKLPKLALPKLVLPAAANLAFGLWKQLPILAQKLLRPPIWPRRLVLAVLGILAASLWIWQRPLTTTQSQQVTTLAGQLNETAIEETLPFLRHNIPNIAALPAEQRAELAQALLGRGIELMALPELISELPHQVIAISSAGELLFLLDETGQLWQLSQNGELKQLDHLFKISQPTGLVAFGETSLVATDNLGNIWYYRGDVNGPVALALPAPLTGGVKQIAKFANNLYIYSSAQNAIYRISGFSGEIGGVAPYNGLAAISQAVLPDLTVNGDFITIVANHIVSWRRDNQTRPPLPYLFADLSSQLDATEKGLIVAQTDNLITVITAANELLWQRYYVSDKKISAVAIIGTNLWFVAAKDAYRVEL